MADRKKSRKTRRVKASDADERPKGKVSAGDASASKSARVRGRKQVSPAPAVKAAAKAEDERGSPAPVGGEVEFDPGIISDIAIREASEIEGIAELTGGWRTKGVTVGEVAEDGESGEDGAAGYILDLRIAVEYGVNCVALAETIRSRIGDAIRRMTGRETVAVNVHVTGLREKGLREEPHEESAPLGEEHGIDF